MQVAQQIGLAEAVRYLQALGMDEVRAHERALTRYAIDQLQAAGATVYGPTDVEDRGGAVSFWYRDVHPHDLAQVLNEEGVCVRAGHHCAQLVMRRYGMPATARASFYVYNTADEIDALVDGARQGGRRLRVLGWRGDNPEGDHGGAGRDLQGSHPRSLQEPRGTSGSCPVPRIRAAGTTRCAATRSGCRPTWRATD